MREVWEWRCKRGRGESGIEKSDGWKERYSRRMYKDVKEKVGW